ncbi:MAG: hypothetical protein DRG69_09920, partial [Deltaproteobacteria bacterium]
VEEEAQALARAKVDESVNEANLEAKEILEAAKKEVEDLRTRASSSIEKATEVVLAKLLGVG